MIPAIFGNGQKELARRSGAAKLQDRNLWHSTPAIFVLVRFRHAILVGP
jgi:hypothetical protein